MFDRHDRYSWSQRGCPLTPSLLPLHLFTRIIGCPPPLSPTCILFIFFSDHSRDVNVFFYHKLYIDQLNTSRLNLCSLLEKSKTYITSNWEIVIFQNSMLYSFFIICINLQKFSFNAGNTAAYTNTQIYTV